MTNNMNNVNNRPVPPPVYQLQPGQALPNPQMPGSSPPPRKSVSLAKIFAGVALAVGAVVLLIGALALASILHTCSAVMFDAPTHDSRAHAAFIKAPQTTERDLETFDALRGSFEEMYYDEVSAFSEAEKEPYHEQAKQAVDEYRALLAQGTWPKDLEHFSSGDSSKSPQLWVRVAQLAQDYIEQETGESWRVVNLSYPFFSNPGPVPDLAQQHDAEDALVTQLVCESGEDKGRMVSVSYFRWAKPAYFESSMEQVRAEVQEQKQLLAKLEKSGLLEDRTCALTRDNYLFVWSQGPQDSLRNPQTFTQFFQDAARILDEEYFGVYLLEQDAPLVLSREFESRYANTPAPELVKSSEAHERLLDCWSSNITAAFADTLLVQHMEPGSGASSSSGESSISPLSGHLVERDIQFFSPWRAVEEATAYDGDATAFVAKQLGLSEEEVLALSLYQKEVSETGSHSTYETWDFHVVLPRGTLPESRADVESIVLDLKQALWQHAYAEADPTATQSIYLFVYLVDPQDLQEKDGIASFGDLRAKAMADVANLTGLSTVLFLRLDTDASRFNANTPCENWDYDYGIYAEGSFTYSRAWFLESHGFTNEFE